MWDRYVFWKRPALNARASCGAAPSRTGWSSIRCCTPRCGKAVSSFKFQVSLPSRRLNRRGWIGSLPGLVRRWSVHRWHWLVQQAQIHRKLRAVMGAVQHAAPEHPDALPSESEERHVLHPPVGGLRGEERESRPRQLLLALKVCAQLWYLREHIGGGWFGRAHKFAEEPALGEQFMVQDVGHGGRLGMWTKIQVVLREATPNREDLVGLAGVGVQQMLEEWVAGARNILRRNGNEVVVHDGASSPGLNCAVPGGLESIGHRDPPLKRWAILFRPAERDWSLRCARIRAKSGASLASATQKGC